MLDGEMVRVEYSSGMTSINVVNISTQQIDNVVLDLVALRIKHNVTMTYYYDPERGTEHKYRHRISMYSLTDVDAMGVTEVLKKYGLEYQLSLNTVHKPGLENELVQDHAWVRSIPTLTTLEECAICGKPRANHETEA